MGIQGMDQFIELIEAVGPADDLMSAMVEISVQLGVQFFALSHHVDAAYAAAGAIRIQYYPARWTDYYDHNAFGVSDPVHRASHVTSIGFCWSRMIERVPRTAADRKILALAREDGIGDGFTMPANVPGEAHGSCSFAIEAGQPLPDTMLPLAKLVGAFAFECAWRIVGKRMAASRGQPPVLTDRPSDRVLWAARGKSDWEISRILGVGEETVIRHIKQARERYGVLKRTLLAIRTLFDRTLPFDDILESWYSPFWD